MPFLVIGGITVPVAVSAQPSQKREQLGEVVRAFDATPRSSVRGKMFDWEIQTTPISEADAASLLTVLEGAHPITCSGDFLGGTLSCVPTAIVSTPVKIGSGSRRVISFRLLGAG